MTSIRPRPGRANSAEYGFWLMRTSWTAEAETPPRCEEVSGEQRLSKTGGRLIKHARYYWLLLAEGHLTRRLFGSMVRRIAVLPVPTG